MAARSAAALTVVPPKKYDADGFQLDEVTLRGVTYKLREVDGEVYDDVFEVATSEPDDEGRRTTDFAMVNKGLLVKALVEPKLTMKEIQKLPFAVRQVLFVKANELHPAFPKEGEPEEPEKKDAAED